MESRTTRQLILGVTLVFTAALAYLTIRVMIEHGIDFLVVLSLLVLALFGFGILGALREPPPGE
jgi:hypothetical protein